MLSEYEQLLYGFNIRDNWQNKLDVSSKTKTIDKELVKMIKL